MRLPLHEFAGREHRGHSKPVGIPRSVDQGLIQIPGNIQRQADERQRTYQGRIRMSTRVLGPEEMGYTQLMAIQRKKSGVPGDIQVVRFSSAKAKYDYKALLRGYEEVFDSKLRKDFAESHQTEVMFSSALAQALDFFNTMNQSRGWSTATPAELAKMERLCKRLDEMLQQYAPFFDRKKILDVGRKILNQEFLGTPSEENKEVTPPASIQEFKARRAGGLR